MPKVIPGKNKYCNVKLSGHTVCNWNVISQQTISQNVNLCMQFLSGWNVCDRGVVSGWRCSLGTGKKTINSFIINFLAPTQNTWFWPSRKSLCASFPGKGHKKGTHRNFFRGTLGSKRGPQTGHFRPHKKFSLLFLACPYSCSRWHVSKDCYIQEPCGYRSSTPISEAPQRGRKNGAARKFVEKCRKTFWHFLTLFDVFCPARKLSKSVEKTFWHFLAIFDVFWRGPFPPAPFAIRWQYC